jgi:enediyne biosynthesis protein E4
MQNKILFATIYFLLSDISPCLSQDQTLFTLLNDKQTGITFSNEIKETEELNVLSYEYFYNGGGVGTGDINNDGLIDLFFTANMKPSKLFLNLGNLKFKDITKQSQIKSTDGWRTGVTMVDVNADGFLDIHVCYSGNGDTQSRRNKLYINNHDLTFTESANAFGLDDPGYSTQAAFFDYDMDGDLDMYLLNHNVKDYKEIELEYLKTTYDSLAGDRLYRNDNMHFVDVTKESGITGNPISFGLGIAVADLNNDEWPDLYISNDYQENDYYYLNNQDGTFSEKSKEAFGHLSYFSMGNDVADINNDGLLDVFTLDMLPEDNKRQKLLKENENYEVYRKAVSNGFHHQYMRNMLHLNNGDGTFSEIGQLSGISNTDWSWSSLFADFDNDGFKDLIVTNGYLRDYTNKDFLKYWGNYIVQKAAKMEPTSLMEIIAGMPSTKIKNYVFKNNGDLTFSKQTDEWGFGQSVISSGAAFADLDNDGDLEVIVNNVNEKAFIYRNNSQTLHRQFLDVRLKGSGNNVNEIGSKVYVFTGTEKQLVCHTPTRGYQSNVSFNLHFGLAEHTKVDSIIIVWPDATRQKLTNISAGQLLTVEKKNTSAVKSSNRTGPAVFIKEEVIRYQHAEYEYNDFKRQPLIPFMHSYVSPVLDHADINKDGLDDLFVGAGKGQPSKIFMQGPDGGMTDYDQPLFAQDKYFSTAGSFFFDADADGDVDLYLTSGGYHDYNPGNPLLNDRLYMNDGTGNFSDRKLIENNQSSKSCVRGADYDRDGDVDLFIGGRVVPGQYPEAPASTLLRNDGAGKFTDVSSSALPSKGALGMITDAAWTDVNEDGSPDLVLVGEWMPITVLINGNNHQSFTNETLSYFKHAYSGFWNVLRFDDLDSDGDLDLVAGNLGLNSQIQASDSYPAEIYFADFDKNGSVDPFVNYYIQGKSYPDVSRDMLLDQIYPMRKKFTSYESYSDAGMKDIFTASELSEAKKLTMNTPHTLLFENNRGKFMPHDLPIQAQFSPVNSITLVDVNEDSIKDILLFGNNSNARLKYGRIDANYGTVLINRGNFSFQFLQNTSSGLQVTGDVKTSIAFRLQNELYLLLGINRGLLSAYRLNSRLYEN